MPQNKNFQKRITILDECFASPTGLYTLEKLKEILNDRLEVTVSRRSIQNDIKEIERIIYEDLAGSVDFDINPIFERGILDGKKKVFRYSSPQYTLGNQLLSKSDKEQLEDTLSILSRYRNRADFDWLDQLFPRIKSSFKLAHEDHEGLISYESNRDYTGQILVGTLYNQLLRNKVINIEYKTFGSDDSYIRKVHPYHLKQFNSRWFLFGHEEGDRYTGITNVALDRIVSISETTEDCKICDIIWSDYFDDMIGVSKPFDVDSVEIKLKFSAQRIPYVLTKPIHGASQRLDKTDSENRTIIINLIPNRELYQTLLSFGADLEVISPLSIRNNIKSVAIKLLENHNS